MRAERLDGRAWPEHGVRAMNLQLLRPYRYGHCLAFSDVLGWGAAEEYWFFNPECITAIPYAGIISLLGVSPYHDPRPT